MLIVKLLIISFLSFFCSSLCADETAQHNSDLTPQEISRLSQAFGNFIGKNLNNPGIQFNLESLIQGIRDGAAGKPSPMTEEEYQEALTKIQEKAVEFQAKDNLKKANEYLAEKAKEKNIVEKEPGKLYYEVLVEGNGPVVKEHDHPKIHFTGRFINGTVFGTSEEMDEPIAVDLDQTIPGFSKGIVGMKEGERRRLFIHPELAYGASGGLPPNELLIFDIEVVKADSKDEGDHSADKEPKDQPKH